METAANENPMAGVALDVQRALKRAHGAKALETRAELVNNVYPLLQQILIAIDERFVRSETAIEELLDDDDSRLEPELAEEIRKVFGLGAQLGEMLVALIPKSDDLQRKRYADAVAQYTAEANRVSALIDEITLMPDGELPEQKPEEDEEEDGDDEDEDDEDADEDDGKAGA